jgi:hypothetical protein
VKPLLWVSQRLLRAGQEAYFPMGERGPRGGRNDTRDDWRTASSRRRGVHGGAAYVAGEAQQLKRPGQEVSERPGPQGASDTLEPRRPASGLGSRSNWPGLAMIAAGAILLLAGAAF